MQLKIYKKINIPEKVKYILFKKISNLYFNIFYLNILFFKYSFFSSLLLKIDKNLFNVPIIDTKLSNIQYIL